MWIILPFWDLCVDLYSINTKSAPSAGTESLSWYFSIICYVFLNCLKIGLLCKYVQNVALVFYLKCNYKLGLSMLLNSSLHCIVDLRCCGRNFKPSSKPATVVRSTPSATPNPRELTFIIYFTFTCMIGIDWFMKCILKGIWHWFLAILPSILRVSFYEFFFCLQQY